MWRVPMAERDILSLSVHRKLSFFVIITLLVLYFFVLFHIFSLNKWLYFIFDAIYIVYLYANRLHFLFSCLGHLHGFDLFIYTNKSRNKNIWKKLKPNQAQIISSKLCQKRYITVATGTMLITRNGASEFNWKNNNPTFSSKTIIPYPQHCI